jgi:hypothetical protein
MQNQTLQNVANFCMKVAADDLKRVVLNVSEVHNKLSRVNAGDNSLHG